MEDFLVTVWCTGARLGTKPENAFAVRSDRTTMTQNDPDNGRMICLIGVAPTYPAEYAIFRISHGPPTRNRVEHGPMKITLSESNRRPNHYDSLRRAYAQNQPFLQVNAGVHLSTESHQFP